MKKKTQKQIKEDAQKAALRKRLIDMANGAGFDDVECGDYWCHDNESLMRLISAVDDAFSDQLEEWVESRLREYTSLTYYNCLNNLHQWLWEVGVRA